MTRRIMLITGGTRGIGRAVALGAAARGWDLALGYRSDAGAAGPTLAEVRALGARALAIPGDLTDPGAVAALFDAAETLGRVDAVVLNAGSVAPSLPLADTDPDRLRRVVEGNLLSALFGAREAARRLPRPAGEPAGAVVLVSSVAARLGSAFEYVDYAAAKAGVDTLALGLARELAGANVRVNAVRPGLIDTDIHASGGRPTRAQDLAHLIPLARPGTADEVAQMILWLCGPEASYVTGAVMEVTGGR